MHPPLLVRYCTADALKRHEPVNAFNLVVSTSAARRHGKSSLETESVGSVLSVF